MATFVRVAKGSEDLVKQRLKEFPAYLRYRILQEAIIECGEIVLEAAEQKVPVGATGRLKASLALKKNITYRKAKVLGVDVLARRSSAFPGGYYSHLVEKGHKLYRTTKWKKYFIKQVAAKPFMRPALFENKKKVYDLFFVRLSEGISKYQSESDTIANIKREYPEFANVD